MLNTNRRIKEIIAVFLKQGSDTIEETTALKISSILKHRMYAALSEHGYHVRDRHEVRNFGDLIRRLESKPLEDQPSKLAQGAENQSTLEMAPTSPHTDPVPGSLGIDIQMGVDLEDIDNLPEVKDVRMEAFYTMTFSEREIAYCLLQENPWQSFTGKFAAKEAIIKIDAAYGKRPMKEIEILNDTRGKPYFEDFNISVSHTARSAVAVAIRQTIGKLVSSHAGDNPPIDGQ